MKRSHTIPCRHCDGKGTVPLKQHLEEILSFVKRHPGCTTEQFHAQFPLVTMAAATNRLEDLIDLGLVTRIRQGKFYYYTALPLK